jgi:hypothetical protein
VTTRARHDNGRTHGRSSREPRRASRGREPLRARLRRATPLDWDRWPRARRVAAEATLPLVRRLFPFHLLTEIEALEILGSSPDPFDPGPRRVPIGRDVATRGDE